MTDRTALIIGGERGTGLLIAQGLTAGGWGPVTEGAPDCVVLVLHGGAAPGSPDALVATVLRPFHDAVNQHAGALHAAGGGFLAVMLLPPAADLWQRIATEALAAAIAACAADWGAGRGTSGPRINGIVAIVDDSPALPRFLAPRPATQAATRRGAARPADVAAVALSLCADSAGAITGQVLRIGSAAG